MSEEQLFKAAADGDESAVEELLTRYKSIVTATARRYFIVGGDSEDLSQEGMIALYRAIKTYRPESGAFAAYAAGCVKNRLLDVIKSANRDKHKALNGYIPLADADELLGAGMSAEEIAISRESGRSFAKRLEGELSNEEKTLLRHYLSGKSYKDIAGAMGVTVKKVDTSLQKLKKKILQIRSCIIEEET